MSAKNKGKIGRVSVLIPRNASDTPEDEPTEKFKANPHSKYVRALAARIGWDKVKRLSE